MKFYNLEYIIKGHSISASDLQKTRSSVLLNLEHISYVTDIKDYIRPLSGISAGVEIASVALINGDTFIINSTEHRLLTLEIRKL